MPIMRPSALSSRALRLTSATTTLRTVTASQLRQSLSTSQSRRSAEGSHEDHYDAPGGWLFGVKPGEKYQSEGWENLWFYGFFGSLAFGVIGYCYKPDTRYVVLCILHAFIRVSTM